jgi:hypothetical protein
LGLPLAGWTAAALEEEERRLAARERQLQREDAERATRWAVDRGAGAWPGMPQVGSLGLGEGEGLSGRGRAQRDCTVWKVFFMLGKHGCLRVRLVSWENFPVGLEWGCEYLWVARGEKIIVWNEDSSVEWGRVRMVRDGKVEVDDDEEEMPQGTAGGTPPAAAGPPLLIEAPSWAGELVAVGEGVVRSSREGFPPLPILPYNPGGAVSNSSVTNQGSVGV